MYHHLTRQDEFGEGGDAPSSWSGDCEDTVSPPRSHVGDLADRPGQRLRKLLAA